MLDAVFQRRDKPDPATYIGSGKALELRDIVLESGPTPSSATVSSAPVS